MAEIVCGDPVVFANWLSTRLRDHKEKLTHTKAQDQLPDHEFRLAQCRNLQTSLGKLHEEYGKKRTIDKNSMEFRSVLLNLAHMDEPWLPKFTFKF